MFIHKTKPLNIIEVSKKNILHNLHLYQKEFGKNTVCPVLKSNAYGHGLKQIVEILKDEDFPYFVVDSYYEALKVLEITKKKNVLIMGYTHRENYRYFDFKKIAVTIYDLDTLKKLTQLKKKIRIHLMINTGMNREGIRKEELPKYLQILQQHPRLTLDGVFSHFADADNGESDMTFTDSQVKEFEHARKTIEQHGFQPTYRHIGNSAGALKYKNPSINMCRLGLGLYGYHSLAQNDPLYSKLSGLKPALRFLSTVTNIVQLQAHEKVSYNCTFTATKRMTMGVVAVGYHECLNRLLSNKGYFRIDNKELPIVGRVCMNLTCFDTKKTPLKIGDQIEIIGDDPTAKNSIYEIATLCQTIPYEILVNINESTRRIVV